MKKNKERKISLPSFLICCLFCQNRKKEEIFSFSNKQILLFGCILNKKELIVSAPLGEVTLFVMLLLLLLVAVAACVSRSSTRGDRRGDWPTRGDQRQKREGAGQRWMAGKSWRDDEEICMLSLQS